MMKKSLITLGLILMLITLPIAVLASDISGALFFGNVIVSENGSVATTNVTSSITNIDTDDLIAGNYLNATANNTVMRNASGADIEFMPGWDGNPWMTFVNSIGADSFLNYILYFAESIGGLIRYFPAAAGMEMADTSMEFGGNFSINQTGYWDTSLGSSKNAVFKDNAFRTYISAAGNITSEIGFGVGPVNEQVSANADDCLVYFNGAVWLIQVAVAGAHPQVGDAGGAFDRMGGGMRFVNVVVPTNATITAANITITSGFNSVNVIVRSYISGEDSDNAAAFSTVADYFGRPRTTANITWDNIPAWVVDTAYTSANISGIIQEIIDRPGWVQGNSIVIFWTDHNNRSAAGARRTSYSHDLDPNKAGQLNVNWLAGFPAASVSALGISTDDHSVTTTANTSHMWISVDGVVEDTTSINGITVPNNSENWTFAENGVLLYLESQNVTIGGNPRQDIEWQYSANFTDQSGNGNDVVPNFATSSSDTDVTANMTTFQPISEARAPDFTIAAGVPFIESTGNMTGNFTTVPPSGAFPLAGVITAVADATSTPAQLPLLIIAVFVILAFSLSYSSVTRRFGSGSIVGKGFIIVAIMGIFVALGDFGIDFWMVVVFIIMVTAISMGSRQQGWN